MCILCIKFTVKFFISRNSDSNSDFLLLLKFTKATKIIVSDTDSMAKMTDESKIAIGEFEHNVSEVCKISMETYHKVSYTQLVADVALAKVHQMIYVQQGYRMMETGSQSKAAQAVNVTHLDCKFGKWLHEGNGYASYNYLSSFKEIDYPHEIVHHCMMMAKTHLDENWQTNPAIQTQIVDNFSSIEENTLLIADLLDALINEKQRFEGSAAETDGEIDLF